MVRARRICGENPNHNKLLTEEERILTDVKLLQGMKIAEISRMLNRSSRCVAKYKNNRETYGTRKSPGRPGKLDMRAKRHVERLLIKHKYSLSRIREFLLVNHIAKVSIQTIYRCIRDMGKSASKTEKRTN